MGKEIIELDKEELKLIRDKLAQYEAVIQQLQRERDEARKTADYYYNNYQNRSEFEIKKQAIDNMMELQRSLREFEVETPQVMMAEKANEILAKLDKIPVFQKREAEAEG